MYQGTVRVWEDSATVKSATPGDNATSASLDTLGLTRMTCADVSIVFQMCNCRTLDSIFAIVVS